jgi:hypothetical protein
LRVPHQTTVSESLPNAASSAPIRQ